MRFLQNLSLCLIASLLAQSVSALTFNEIAASCARDLGTTINPSDEPLQSCQWWLGKHGIDKAHARGITGAGVKIGILGTGFDLFHPDIASNVDVEKSCNFVHPGNPYTNITSEMSEIGDCSNKHVFAEWGRELVLASAIAAPRNDFGWLGIAPQAKIASLRVCTGVDVYCDPSSVAEAIRYGADNGFDILLMNFIQDVYIYYCHNGTPEEKATLRLIDSAVQYAKQKGVMIVNGVGYVFADVHKQRFTEDLPWDNPINRTIGPNCPFLPQGHLALTHQNYDGDLLYFFSSGTSEVTATVYNLELRIFTYTDARSIQWEPVSSKLVETLSNANSSHYCGGNGRLQYVNGASYCLQYNTLGESIGVGIAALAKQKYPKLSVDALVAKLKQSADPKPCPSNWDPTDPRQCTGSAQTNSFFGSGVLNADKLTK